MIPNASDLVYFLEVSKTNNISRASERLGISQPSLTLAMQRLESTVGAQLLLRNKQGVFLTQSGKQLQVHAQNLLRSWERVKTQALASTKEVQGTYSLGCHPSVALYSLPHFLPELLKKHPKLNLQLKHALSRQILESM